MSHDRLIESVAFTTASDRVYAYVSLNSVFAHGYYVLMVSL
jgi:hypothetical protein